MSDNRNLWLEGTDLSPLLSSTAANEWGQYGITVNVINPVIETDAYRADLPDPTVRRQFEDTIPVHRIGQPRDCARVAVFIAGPDASYMTGLTFAVDGGLTSRPQTLASHLSRCRFSGISTNTCSGATEPS